MDAAPPLLGDVLLARNLVSAEQLAAALDEQQRTGRRLGEILVASGAVSPSTMACALAEQADGIARTEYGISYGFGDRMLRAAPPPRAPSADGLRAELEAVAEAVAAKRRELAALTNELREAKRSTTQVRHEEFFVAADVDGRRVVHMARGASPAVGAAVRLPGVTDKTFHVARTAWRLCVYVVAP